MNDKKKCNSEKGSTGSTGSMSSMGSKVKASDDQLGENSSGECMKSASKDKCRKG